MAMSHDANALYNHTFMYRPQLILCTLRDCVVIEGVDASHDCATLLRNYWLLHTANRE